MNKQIKELAVKAKLYAASSLPSNWDEGDYIISPKELEKFAELIIRECFKAAMIEAKGHMNPVDLMKRMKEHVGIEE
jgi:hypothetical protein